MNVKEVRVILSKEADEVYRYLNRDAEKSKQARMILKAVNNKIQLIKANKHYGDGIAKDQIPKEYILKYGTNNLFRVELPTFWRMLYTLIDNDKIEIIAFVLDIIDHPAYNKKFGYRKK